MTLTRTRRGGRNRGSRHRGGNSSINGDSGFPSNWCNPSSGVTGVMPLSCGVAKAGGSRKTRRGKRQSLTGNKKKRHQSRKHRRSRRSRR